ncbi:MAG: hypothetical protein QXU23_02535 [Candidatus Korarchaeum sp.]
MTGMVPTESVAFNPLSPSGKGENVKTADRSEDPIEEDMGVRIETFTLNCFTHNPHRRMNLCEISSSEPMLGR